MFYQDSKLQYPVRVDEPSPLFAKYLQQAIGGIEGEIRVCLQYLFQAFGARGPAKYRDMLMETGTEEMGHIEMLATAVALNLENAPIEAQEEAAKDPMVGAVMGGMNPRHVLSSGLSAMPVNSNGIPFDCSHVYATGNLAADMYANVTAESGGRVLACRLYHATDDAGMKDMLKFLIARDTMHQEQWLAVIEELGGNQVHPIPNSFPQDEELQDVNYTFMSTGINGVEPPEGRWSSGPAIDGKGTFKMEKMQPRGQKPDLGMARPKSGAQAEQIGDHEGLLEKAKDVLS
ncbi:MAG: manganese catalase family protein [Rhodothermales bacterium]